MDLHHCYLISIHTKTWRWRAIKLVRMSSYGGPYTHRTINRFLHPCYAVQMDYPLCLFHFDSQDWWLSEYPNNGIWVDAATVRQTIFCLAPSIFKSKGSRVSIGPSAKQTLPSSSGAIQYLISNAYGQLLNSFASLF